jgi:23S rRNA (cytidine1920-2'-O)/16S rRNA (cytidine1409-2'-O)-methyltransferase
VPIYKKRRLDQLLVEIGLAPSRSRAADLVRRGLVSVAGVPALKPGAQVTPDAELKLAPGASRYVSRGGEKLEAALDAFGFDPECTIALDVGASTGGFSDVLIARGAAKIYAVDVGSGQLHSKLRVNPRVVVLEDTDARALDRTVINEAVTAVVADVSFIVRKAAERTKAVEKVRGFIEDAGWTVVGEIASPILGGSGNEEFLIGARYAA